MGGGAEGSGAGPDHEPVRGCGGVPRGAAWTIGPASAAWAVEAAGPVSAARRSGRNGRAASRSGLRPGRYEPAASVPFDRSGRVWILARHAGTAAPSSCSRAR